MTADLALVPVRPVAAYFRLSEDRDVPVSIASQREKVTEAASARGWGAPLLDHRHHGDRPVDVVRVEVSGPRRLPDAG